MKNYLIKTIYDLELDRVESSEIQAENNFSEPLEFSEILSIIN